MSSIVAYGQDSVLNTSKQSKFLVIQPNHLDLDDDISNIQPSFIFNQDSNQLTYVCGDIIKVYAVKDEVRLAEMERKSQLFETLVFGLISIAAFAMMTLIAYFAMR